MGIRRTEINPSPISSVLSLAAFIECEPITVIFSQKGWIRATKGHQETLTSIKFKEGDKGRFIINAETTDKLLLFCTNGRFYTLNCNKLPSGRGHGEPLKLMIDLGNEHEIVSVMVYRPGSKLIVASSDGRGFIVPQSDVIAQTRNGKQVLNVSGKVKAQACSILQGDTLAVVGENHKLILFPVSELPEMSRGRGVKLQSYKDGGLSDVQVFFSEKGLRWRSGERIRTEFDLNLFMGKRAQSGRIAPRGFPRSNRFGKLEKY